MTSTPSHAEPHDVASNNELQKAYREACDFYAQGRFENALDVCLRVTRMYPDLWLAWTDAAVVCVRLERWEEAIAHGECAIRLGGNSLTLFDALSHACGSLHKWDAMRRYGLLALTLRDQQFQCRTLGDHALPPLPQAPSAATRECNVIAFSLFGANSKYCETAVLNAQEQERIYPDWTCRFYVDESVPRTVCARLATAGAQVVVVGSVAELIPGPMWRLLALDDPRIHRVIFRDADSVISEREAQAVHAWVESGKHFHAMRDCPTHTELLLAGLWGAVPAALPEFQKLLQRFLSEPIASVHFADQFFLRQFVWPYARQSLMQHDSMFGFLEAAPFPGGPPPENFHVGFAEGASFFVMDSNLPEGTAVQWSLFLCEEAGTEQVVCRYPAVVSQGRASAHLPERYVVRTRNGYARIQVDSANYLAC